MDKLSRTVVIMPAYNEAGHIQEIIRETRLKAPKVTIVVVNDGSTDETSSLARAAGATVLDLPFNLGVGGAMRAGFVFAKQYKFEYLVQLDSDGQHDPSYISKLIDEVEHYDLVLGVRFAGVGDYKVQGPRKWAMSLLSKSLSFMCKTQLTDTTSGFKAMSSKTINVFASNYPAEYLGDTVEALLIASQNGLKIGQVPVAMRERAFGEPSQSPLKSAIYLGRAFMALLIGITRR